jgi:hypothetical protein
MEYYSKYEDDCVYNTDDIGNSGGEKHNKYKDSYGSNEVFFGLGIENEVYLELESGIEFTEEKFLKNRRRERYSVDYNTSYDQQLLEEFLSLYIKKTGSTIKLPLLVNCHSFMYTDKENNPRTMYTKLCEPNPKYLGKTLHELIMENEYLKQSYEKSWMYDGDTVEFMTTNFYNATTEMVVNELKNARTEFVDNLNKFLKENNIFQKYGNIQLMKDNHPFAVYLTNIYNCNMFNNGTIHMNITLPTYLNEECKIKNKSKFVLEHKHYIKYIQFIEPLFIAMFGSPDVFSQMCTDTDKNKLFSAASQRCALSRYIGVGTYDCNSMKPGKLLTEDICLMDHCNNENWWYNLFHKKSAYSKLSKVGFDINFNKHYNHGVELRIFDHINDINIIKEILDFLVYLGDFILDCDNFEVVSEAINPVYDKNWNDFMEKIIRNGKSVELTNKHKIMYSHIFCNMFNADTVSDLYNEIKLYLKNKYDGCGKFSKLAIKKNQ